MRVTSHGIRFLFLYFFPLPGDNATGPGVSFVLPLNRCTPISSREITTPGIIHHALSGLAYARYDSKKDLWKNDGVARTLGNDAGFINLLSEQRGSGGS